MITTLAKVYHDKPSTAEIRLDRARTQQLMEQTTLLLLPSNA